MEHEIERCPEVQRKVSIDHIIKLLRSNKKNSILIIKDQNNEMIHLKVVKKKEKVFEM